MLPVGPKGSKRRRNKSSPGHEKVSQRRRGFKQNKLLNDLENQEPSELSDYSDSEYFSDIGDLPCVKAVPTLLPTTLFTSTMVKLLKSDIDDIVAKLAPTLVKEIKAQLMSEVKELVKEETTKMLGDLECLRS